MDYHRNEGVEVMLHTDDFSPFVYLIFHNSYSFGHKNYQNNTWVVSFLINCMTRYLFDLIEKEMIVDSESLRNKTFSLGPNFLQFCHYYFFLPLLQMSRHFPKYFVNIIYRYSFS